MSIVKVTTSTQLEEVFYIRKKVFVEEQGVPIDDEFDQHDQYCDHILAYHKSVPAGTGRIRFLNTTAKLERICVLDSYRKEGYGRKIIVSLEKVAAEKAMTTIKLHGQVHAKGFYEKLGYKVEGDEFVEDGIPHLLMTKNV
ncbi:GNAT family N-acetyltransferase [Halobacillus sp. A1]|uniref:GNAT family N-acetyltransferase n=1 Tax=Halobacillus sp. A1 TaxID=2880262 RepID=UPI0020A66775|nr:GNAT family N-acetyltransferase [Halobacillus sp. A1]MCP3031877.1 GNAT family N-acetyltransferase [Halobacillus sp. A1]